MKRWHLASDLWSLVPKGRVARGTASTFGVKLLAMPCILLLQFGMVRLLRPEAYGEFMYAYTWYVALLPFAALGLHEATVRFISEYRAREDGPAFHGFLSWSRGVTLAAGFLVAAVAMAVTLALRSRMTPTLFIALALAWIYVPLGTTGTLASMVLRGLERFVAAQAPPQIVQPLLAVGLAWLLVVGLGMAPTAVTGMLALLAAVVVFVGLSTWFAWSRARTVLPTPQRQRRTTEWVNASAHFLGLAAVPLLLRADVLLLGVFRGTFEAGVYATVVQLQLLTAFGFNTLMVVLAPAISRLHAQRDRAELQRGLRLSLFGTGTIALGVAAGLALFGSPVLRLFDPAFAVGYVPLMILVGGQLYHVFTGPVGRVLTMTGRHRPAFWLALGAALTNAASNVVLIPLMGLEGAALATAGSLVLWKTIGAAYVRHTMRVDPTVLTFAPGQP
jgi:O-antigen/teichoic acid export membrane protein